MDLRKNILGGMMGGVAGYAIKIGVNLFTLPLMIRYLGAQDYGFYVFLFGFAELLMLLELGVMNGLIQRISHCQTTGDETGKREFFQVGHALFATAVLLLAVLAVPVGQQAGALFHLNPAQQAVAPWAFALVFWNTAANLYGCYYQAVLKTHCLHRWISVNDTIQVVVSSALSVGLAMAGHGLAAIFAARLLVTTLNTLAYLIRAVQVEPDCFKLSISLPLARFRSLFGISAFVLLERLGQALSRQTDALLIARFLSMADVGLYGFVNRIFAYLSLMIGQMIDVMFPVFSGLAAANEQEKAQRFFLRLSALTAYLAALLILLILGVFPEAVRVLGAGRIPQDDAWRLAWLVFPAVWMEAVAAPGMHYLFASGHYRRITIFSLAAAAINFMLSLALIKPLGILGPAAATACISLIFHQCVSVVMACRQLGLPVTTFMGEVYLRNLPSLGIAALLIAGGRWLYEFQAFHPLVWLAELGAIGLISVLVWLITATTVQERRLLYEKTGMAQWGFLRIREAERQALD